NTKNSRGTEVTEDGIHLTPHSSAYAISIVYKEGRRITLRIVRNISVAVGLNFQRIARGIRLIEILEPACATGTVVQADLSQNADSRTCRIRCNKPPHTIPSSVVPAHDRSSNIAGCTTYHRLAAAIVVADD